MYSARLSSRYTAFGLAMGPSFRSPMTFSHRRSRHRGHSWRGCHGVPRQLQGLWEEISLHKSGMWTSQLKRLAKGLPIQPLRASCQFVKNFWLISQPCSAWAFATSKSLAVTNTGSESPRLHIQHTVDLKYSSAKAPVFLLLPMSDTSVHRGPPGPEPSHPGTMLVVFVCGGFFVAGVLGCQVGQEEIMVKKKADSTLSTSQPVP